MNLDSQLVQLENSALIRRVADSEPTFFFHHTLTQESIYRALLKPARREMHLSVAHAIEQVYADGLDDYAALLAQHYAQGQDDAKTFEYSVRAGQAALRVYAHAEAIAHFSRGLEILKKSPALAAPARLRELYLQLGRTFEISGRFDDALHLYEEMESLALQHDDRALQLAALVALATIHSTPTALADPSHARTLNNLALALSREIGDCATEARVLWNLMNLSVLIGEMESAIDYGEQSLTIAREQGMEEQLALTQNDLFRPYASLGHFDRGREASAQAREYFRKSGNLPLLADNLIRSTVVDTVFGEFDRAFARSEEGRKISESIGNTWGQSFSQMTVGAIYFQRGEIARAIEAMRESVRLSRVAGFLLPQIFTASALGLVYGMLGDVDRGIEITQEARTLAAERFPRLVSTVEVILARLETLHGNMLRAESYLQENRGITLVDFAQRSFDQTQVAEIQLLVAQKNWGRAIQMADEAHKQMCDSGWRVYRAEMLHFKGIALDAIGEPAAARQVFLQAREEAEQLGSRWMLWQIYAALGEGVPARGIVEFIVQNTPDGLRESFLNLPNVREVLTR